LWLTIARHVVEDKKDISKAMKFIRETELKIEDILPFFPDFVQIDEFKHEITNSLKDYNRDIEILETEMGIATKSSEMIRNNMEENKKKFRIIDVKNKCDLCLVPIISKGFYVFPCQHMFHCDCLKEKVIPTLTKKEIGEANRLESAIAALESQLIRSGSVVHREQLHKLKGAYDEVVATSCLLCGDFAVDSITKPFTNFQDNDWTLNVTHL